MIEYWKNILVLLLKNTDGTLKPLMKDMYKTKYGQG